MTDKLRNRFNQIKSASQVLKQQRLESLLFDISHMKMNDRLEVLAWEVIEEFNCGSIRLTDLIRKFEKQSA